MALIFQWEGTYDDTTADSGEDITPNNLSDGGGDGGQDSTLYNGNSDWMRIDNLSASAGILQQSGDSVLNINQGTILIRFFFDDNDLDNQYLFGWYDGSTQDYIYIDYINYGAGRLYIYFRDNGSGNTYNAYMSWTPTNSTFYDLRVTWDLDTDSSVYFSVDGGAWSRTAETGNMSDIVIGELLPTNLYIGARNEYGTIFRGEISRLLISDVYEDLSLGVAAGGVAFGGLYGKALSGSLGGRGV